MKTYNIAVIKGDGIGPEIVDEAIKVLNVVSSKCGFELKYSEYLMGGAAIDATGEPLPQATVDGAKASDAVLFGAIGGEKWDTQPRHLRPASVYEELVNASPLKPEIVSGVDMLVVRELTGGIYFGEPRGKDDFKGYNTMVYTKPEIERIARVAFESAMKRRKKLTSVDKANVLEVSQLWRDTVVEM